MGTWGGDTAGAAGDDITNVFVLMLEEPLVRQRLRDVGHRRDPRGDEGRQQYVAATGWGEEQTSHVTDDAPWTMTTDPGHEFEDVVEQLCGVLVCCLPGTDPDTPKVRCSDESDCYRGGPYPAIDMSGFATNYAYSQSEGTGRPDPSRVPNIMACFNTKRDLPVIHQLATEFAICDVLFSSLPARLAEPVLRARGVVGRNGREPEHGRRGRLGDDPRLRVRHGSIFHHLSEAGHERRLYQDKHNDYSDDPSPGTGVGGLAGGSLKGISLLDVDDLRGSRRPAPARRRGGPSTSTSPTPSSSRTPGEASIPRRPRDAGRPTRVGPPSIPRTTVGGRGPDQGGTSDPKPARLGHQPADRCLRRHGGSPTRCRPARLRPPATVSQGPREAQRVRFRLRHLRRARAGGGGVPASRCTVDHTLYDHSSVLATVECLLGMDALTQRDAAAKDLPAPAVVARAPHRLPDRARATGKASRASSRPSSRVGGQPRPSGRCRRVPLPTGSNAARFLHVLVKAEFEAAAGDDQDAHADGEGRRRRGHRATR